MNASLDYLITPTDDHHHAEWIIENRLAVGRREPSRPGATDGRFEIHFVSAHDNSEILGRCSNLHLDFIPPNQDGNRNMLPCITVYKSMEQLEFAEAIWNVATIAAELLFNEPTMTSANLFRELSDPVNYLDLILEDPLMSVDAQRGLIGEIHFLLYLIQRCGAQGIPVRNAINSWKNEARDFNRNGITFEIKSSGGPDRIHTISNISQLEPRPTDHQLHVISSSVCRDSGGWNLPEWVDALLGVLAEPYHDLVLNKIRTWWRGSRGYDPNSRGVFINEPKFTSIFESKSYRIHPEMNPAVDLLNTSSFEGDALPNNATQIQYKLDLRIHPEPLSENDLIAAIDLILN
jgi:hypothetical protein